MLLKIFPLLFLGLITSGVTKPLTVNHTVFDVIHEWKFLEFEYDTASRQENIMNNSRYDKTRNLLVDFDIAKDGRVFVVVQKNEKVPATLNTVSTNIAESGPLLKPFPDWQWHARNDCIGIRSVYRIQIDECNRLWVLDSGIDSGDRVCPAQLLMFDLSSDELKLKVNIPQEFYSDRDGDGDLNYMILQSEGGWWCKNTYVYMTYLGGSGLVVWDGNKIWRLNGPDKTKLSGSLKINGLELIVDYSNLGLALSPKIDNEPQYLAIRSPGTKHVFTVKIDDIIATSTDSQNVQLSDILNVILDTWSEPEKPSDNKTVNYTFYENVLPTTAAAMSFNPQGILFMGLNELIAIGCWNSTQNLSADNIDVIDKDEEKLRWVTSAKVLQTSRTGNDEEELWIATNNIAEFVYDTMDYNKSNFRIMKQKTNRILTNSKCIN